MLLLSFGFFVVLFKSLSGTPYRRLLQLSKRDVTNAWTRISVVTLFRNERIWPIRLKCQGGVTADDVDVFSHC